MQLPQPQKMLLAVLVAGLAEQGALAAAAAAAAAVAVIAYSKERRRTARAQTQRRVVGKAQAGTPLPKVQMQGHMPGGQWRICHSR